MIWAIWSLPVNHNSQNMTSQLAQMIRRGAIRIEFVDHSTQVEMLKNARWTSPGAMVLATVLFAIPAILLSGTPEQGIGPTIVL